MESVKVVRLMKFLMISLKFAFVQAEHSRIVNLYVLNVLQRWLYLKMNANVFSIIMNQALEFVRDVFGKQMVLNVRETFLDLSCFYYLFILQFC